MEFYSLVKPGLNLSVSLSQCYYFFFFLQADAIGPLIKVIHPDTVHFNWNGTEFIGSINVENISDKNVLYKVGFYTSH